MISSIAISIGLIGFAADRGIGCDQLATSGFGEQWNGYAKNHTVPLLPEAQFLDLETPG
ncbi:hypothetical protein [Paraburkholderia sp. UYCP14C]|uniref:hypothetical protein n=1 Tax=Paraburkholderia sp. UYCP14C TaxID=2511130 RepID=UPI00145A00C5|nr:hypothetical protein [Paraburkholderia sp. UYCP14C]